MVLGVNTCLVSINSEGSADRIPVILLLFLLPDREKKRKSTKVSRNEESRRGSGEMKKKGRHAFQDTSRVTRPRGLVCKSGLAIGYADDDRR